MFKICATQAKACLPVEEGHVYVDCVVFRGTVKGGRYWRDSFDAGFLVGRIMPVFSSDTGLAFLGPQRQIQISKENDMLLACCSLC